MTGKPRFLLATRVAGAPGRLDISTRSDFYSMIRANSAQGWRESPRIDQDARIWAGMPGAPWGRPDRLVWGLL